MSYFILFWQSNVLEWPVYLLALRAFVPTTGLVRGAAWVTLMNSLTHPFIFFVIMNLRLTYLQNILLAELFAVVVEALLLARFARVSWRAALAVSAFANFLSWQLAPMLTFAWAG